MGKPVHCLDDGVREQKCAATWGDILANTASYLLFEKAEFIVHKEQLIKQRGIVAKQFLSKRWKRGRFVHLPFHGTATSFSLLLNHF